MIPWLHACNHSFVRALNDPLLGDIITRARWHQTFKPKWIINFHANVIGCANEHREIWNPNGKENGKGVLAFENME